MYRFCFEFPGGNMNKLIFMLVILIIESIFISGCSHQVRRTKFSDAKLRVCVDPASIDAPNYIKIENALVSSGHFIVVDRSMGFKAIKAEQEETYKNNPDRYANREKYAHWAKLYGCGSIVVAQTQCQALQGFLSGYYNHCEQNIQILDANTAEITAVADGQEDTDKNETSIAPDWDKTVDRLVSNYPKYFEPNKDTKELKEYKQLSEEEYARFHDWQINEERRKAAESTAPASVEPAKAEAKPEVKQEPKVIQVESPTDVKAKEPNIETHEAAPKSDPIENSNNKATSLQSENKHNVKL